MSLPNIITVAMIKKRKGGQLSYTTTTTTTSSASPLQVIQKQLTENRMHSDGAKSDFKGWGTAFICSTGVPVSVDGIIEIKSVITIYTTGFH